MGDVEVVDDGGTADQGDIRVTKPSITGAINDQIRDDPLGNARSALWAIYEAADIAIYYASAERIVDVAQKIRVQLGRIDKLLGGKNNE